MTRNPKVDAQLLEREYVYSPEKPSITSLADKHGLARSGVADKARIGEWYRKRLAYEAQIAQNVMQALGEKWAQQGLALREKVLTVAEKTLDRYLDLLADTEKPYKPDAKDAALMAQVIRQSLADIENAARPTTIIEGEAEDMDPDRAAEVIAMARAALSRGTPRIEAGEAPDDDLPASS